MNEREGDRGRGKCKGKGSALIDRETERQRDRETERQRQTDKQTNRDKQRDKEKSLMVQLDVREQIYSGRCESHHDERAYWWSVLAVFSFQFPAVIPFVIR